MRHTKKVGSAGRFGARYGVRIRKLVSRIEAKTRSPHKCPRCSTPKVKRVGLGIWQCKKCNYKFAGGCWLPQTEPGKVSLRVGSSTQSKV